MVENRSSSSEPSRPQRGGYLPVWRVVPRFELRAVILGAVPACCPIHWRDDIKRTRPHLKPECPLCARNLDWRWKGWVACVAAPSWQPGILELSASGLWGLVAAGEQFGQVRGLLVNVTRRSNRPDGSELLAVEKTYKQDKIPPSFDPRFTLARIWALPPAAPNQPAWDGGDSPFFPFASPPAELPDQAAEEQ